MDKTEGQTGLSSFGRATSLGEEKQVEFRTCDNIVREISNTLELRFSMASHKQPFII